MIKEDVEMGDGGDDHASKADEKVLINWEET